MTWDVVLLPVVIILLREVYLCVLVLELGEHQTIAFLHGMNTAVECSGPQLALLFISFLHSLSMVVDAVVAGMVECNTTPLCIAIMHTFVSHDSDFLLDAVGKVVGVDLHFILVLLVVVAITLIYGTVIHTVCKALQLL